LIGRLAVDKNIANRFIKHAIAQVQYGRPPGQDEGMASQPDVHVPVRVTQKMIARAQYEKELRELGSEEEEELEVIGDAESDKSKGKGKANVDEILASATQDVVGQKRRRAPVDPFSGECLLYIV
jgi:exosome complex protein LRP1